MWSSTELQPLRALVIPFLWAKAFLWIRLPVEPGLDLAVDAMGYGLLLLWFGPLIPLTPAAENRALQLLRGGLLLLVVWSLLDFTLLAESLQGVYQLKYLPVLFLPMIFLEGLLVGLLLPYCLLNIMNAGDVASAPTWLKAAMVLEALGLLGILIEPIQETMPGSMVYVLHHAGQIAEVPLILALLIFQNHVRARLGEPA